MKHLKLLIVIAVLAIAVLFKDRFLGLPEMQQLKSSINRIEKSISAPDPLRSQENAVDAFLTRDGVFKETNVERQKNGLPIFLLNTRLNEAASKKIQDMFARQYFAHIAPDGTQASDLAAKAQYEYVAIGENLALGNFQNDQVLVQAWMDSPGHRANILNRKFQDIGLAVAKGTFEGKTTWLAVQIFGLSKTACPAPSSDLEIRIDNNEKTLVQMQAQLKALKDEIEASSWSARRNEEYNQKIDEYNKLVVDYNALIGMTKGMIAKYNGEVKAFNECVGR